MNKHKHILVTFIVVMVVLLSMTAFVAANTQGQTMNFTVYSKNYSNYSKTSLYSSSGMMARTYIGSQSGTVGTGYMGTLPRLYNESGQLVAIASSWYYNASPLVGIESGTDVYGVRGTYYSQGQTRAYNGNGYTTQTTYRTPSEAY